MSQGHDLDRLIDGYPALVVKGLLAAAQTRRRHLLAEQAVALTVAVTGPWTWPLTRVRGK